MFTKPGILLFLFFIVQISLTKEQDCQTFSTCNSTCSWADCCAQIDCTNCSPNFYCQPEIITGSVSWCTVQVNDPLTPSLINTIMITFESSNDCASCNGGTMCCSSDDTVIPINCSTVSTLTLSSQLSEYSSTTLITSSLSVHFTTSNIVSITTGVPATRLPSPAVPFNTIGIVVPVVVVGIALLLVVITSISCIVVMCKKHSRGKQTVELRKQNWNIDMTECEAYGKLEVNSEKINMTACSAYETHQTMQNVVHPEYEDVTAT